MTARGAAKPLGLADNRHRNRSIVIHRLPQRRRGVRSLRDCRHWRTHAPLDYRGPRPNGKASLTLGCDQLLRRRACSVAIRLLGLQRSHLPEFRKRFQLANVPSRVPNEPSSMRVFHMRTPQWALMRRSVDRKKRCLTQIP